MLPNIADDQFWHSLDVLLATCDIVVDRPKGTPHPRHPVFVYSLDYGYLRGTQSGDGDGIDVWIGSALEQGLVGIICTVDLVERDAELKLLLGCTPEEAGMALASHNRGAQSGILLWRPGLHPSAATERQR